MVLHHNLPGLTLLCTKVQWGVSSRLLKAAILVGWFPPLEGWGAGGRSSRLTALPLRVAEFQVLAGASRVLAGAVGAADALDLVVQGLEGGVHLDVMLSQGTVCLIGPHVLQGVRALLSLP